MITVRFITQHVALCLLGTALLAACGSKIPARVETVDERPTRCVVARTHST
jgi:hypothetical protein